jgi:hypothetical protein
MDAHRRRFVSWSRYSPSVVQVTSNLMSPCCSTCSFFIASLSGPMDHPSPITSSVTPCRMSLWARPSAISVSVAQLSMLTNPGATAMPRASTSVFALALPRFSTLMMRSPWTATSPVNGLPPPPS